MVIYLNLFDSCTAKGRIFDFPYDDDDDDDDDVKNQSLNMQSKFLLIKQSFSFSQKLLIQFKVFTLFTVCKINI